ncbi:uncharacterized protein LOC141674283 [Apium graveolens]|uniref:uncharacterized protein LOC141674283 n=1 Tax=Apium graveolens TaxID=4045 RepID=UPI003D78DF10
MGGASDNVDPDIIEELLGMLDKNNELVKAFCMARNRFENEDLDEFKLVLISSQSSSGRSNHITPSDKVGAFIVSDNTDAGGFRDTRRHVSLREYYCYKIMIHNSEGLTPHLAGRLWQQYVVDQFAAIEQYRLDWKRGLPHMHMLIWLSPESRPNSIEKVDQLVSAEIPDKNSDPIAYETVKNYMMHGPCGLMVIPILTIVVFLFIGGVTLCHINLKICNSSRSLKYLFKYCLKGHDTATMLLKKKSDKSGSEQTARFVKNLDEVKNFLDGRYVCASEASWKIFGFDIHHRSPSVECLPIHFPRQKYLNFQSSADLENFTWIKKTAKWKLRQRRDVVGRLAEVHATTGELLYLRMLLLRCKGALFFSQLRTIDGTTYDTFKEACGALGLLSNDKQWHDALEENAFSAMPTQIRAMFVNILANCSVSDRLALWEKHCPTLSDDVLYIRRKISDNIHLTLSEYEIQNYALAEIEKLLNDVGKSLRDFHMMPFPDKRFFHTFVNRLIVEETSYNKEEMRLNHDKAHKNLNSRQLDVYNAVVDHVNTNKGGMFFVYGSGGCGKTFLWQTLCSRFRSEGKIVLLVAAQELLLHFFLVAEQLILGLKYRLNLIRALLLE